MPDSTSVIAGAPRVAQPSATEAAERLALKAPLANLGGSQGPREEEAAAFRL
jgi:hypothetical protein